MKGKNNTGVVISETETLVAGTEVEITDHTPFMDWNKLRVEFAGRAMQGILSGTNNPTIVIDTKSAVKSAVIYADTLIEELKKR